MNKIELSLVLKNSDKAFYTLEELKREGFNGTVISTESLRHVIEDDPQEHHFLNLRHIEERELMQSILVIFIVDEDKLETIKNVIRNYTDNFKAIKGCMYSRPMSDYEGSI